MRRGSRSRMREYEREETAKANEKASGQIRRLLSDAVSFASAKAEKVLIYSQDDDDKSRTGRNKRVGAVWLIKGEALDWLANQDDTEVTYPDYIVAAYYGDVEEITAKSLLEGKNAAYRIIDLSTMKPDYPAYFFTASFGFMSNKPLTTKAFS